MSDAESRTRQSQLRRVAPWLLLTVPGLALAVLFHAGVALPLRTGVVVMAVVSLGGIWRARVSTLSLLPRFMVLLYALPFSTLLGYLVNPEFTWIFTARGQEIISDRLVVRQLVTVGLVGLLGLLAGLRWAVITRRRAPETDRTIVQRTGRTLAAPVFLAILPVSILFSWLSSPPETIFEAAYASGQSDAIAIKINFPAAFMVSYILLVILFIDAEREGRASWRRAKFLAIGLAATYIVIVLQLLRGDRESSGLVAALVALYVTSPAGITPGRRLGSVARRRMFWLMLPIGALFAVFVALGSLRATLSEAAEAVRPVEAVQLGLAGSTWTGVLWTNLSVAWEYREGLLRYKYGQTYLDYALSLPPGVVTHALGIERPLEPLRGIAWEDAAGVSSGGLHAAVAPFRNFGAFGVFFILMLYGYIIARIEQRGEAGTVGARVLWGSVFCASFMWFWYGDMSFIRALMLAALAYIGYRIALSVQWTSPRTTLSEGVYIRQ